ncbi:formyl peptide receptor 2-like [Gastrophryne carolinensis]
MENSTTDTYEDFIGIRYKAIDFRRVYSMVALSVVSLLGTVGNGLVIWFVIFKMKKTVTSVWFLSLALADFTFSLVQPFYVTYIALNDHWPFGGFMCKLYFFLVPLNLCSSVLHLTVIGIDRCVCVVFPVWCRNHRTTRLAWMVTLGVWILATGSNVPFLIFTNPYSFYFGVCDGRKSHVLQKEKVLMRFILFFVVPLIIIVSCYTVIIRRMRRNRMGTSTKPFRMIASIIICFFICWFPFHVSYIFKVFYSHTLYVIMKIVLSVSVTLAYANSCVNPFLYVFFGRDFKERFWISIQSALRRAFTEEPNWSDPERPTAQGRAPANHDGGMPLAAQNLNLREAMVSIPSPTDIPLANVA